MRSKIIALIFLLGICTLDKVEAQTTVTTAVPFILITPDSRAGGMGETGVAIADNVWATFWNPAGLAFQQGSELAMTHTNWLPGLGLSDIWIAHLAYKQPIEALDGVVGGQLTYLNLGEFIRTSSSGPEEIGRFKAFEYAITAGFATTISDNFSIGLNLRLIHSSLSPYSTEGETGTGIATSVSGDIGILYKLLLSQANVLVIFFQFAFDYLVPYLFRFFLLA